MNFYLFVGLVFVCQSLVWLGYKIAKSNSAIDVGWAFSIAVIGLTLMYPFSGIISKISCILLIVWALRLGLFLFWTRVRKHHNDSRYQELSSKSNFTEDLYYFYNCQLQGLLIALITTPFHFVQYQNSSMTTWHYFAIFLFSAGLLIEIISDYSLLSHKHKHPGTLLKTGFWAYSRHPNYFGEWLIWIAFALLGMSFTDTTTYLALISPITLYLIMNYITIPLSEKISLEKKQKEYKQYQKEVSKFFLLPKKL